MLHIVVAFGSVSITLALILTPAVRSMAAAIWEWLKGLFVKKEAPPSRHIEVDIERTSRNGNTLRLKFTYTSLLSQFPGAIGGGFPKAPNHPAIHEPEQLLLPPPLTHPQPTNMSESPTVSS